MKSLYVIQAYIVFNEHAFIHFFVNRIPTRLGKLTAQTWQVVVCSCHLKKEFTHISAIITPTTWQELFTVAPKTCVKMTVLQTVLIIADIDNSLWKTSTFSQSLLQDINIQYSLENALSYEDMQVWVWVYVCTRMWIQYSFCCRRTIYA